MKNFFIAGLVCLTVLSCQKNDLMYSCNKEADAWVKENLSTVKHMTRKEWKEIDPILGRACWGAFSPKQRALFWSDKLAQVYSLDWTEQEAEHIASLNRFLEDNPEIFSVVLEDNEVLFDKLDRFMYEWSDYAIQVLGWTKDLVGAIAASGYDLADKAGNLYVHTQVNSDMRAIAGHDCQCNVAHDFCSSPLECMVDPDCYEKSWGCGWFITNKCNGSCKQAAWAKPDPSIPVTTN